MQVSAGSQLQGDKTLFSPSYSTNSTKEEQSRQGTKRQCKGSTEQRVLNVRGHQGVSKEASWKRWCEEEPWTTREVELERQDAPSPGIME